MILTLLDSPKMLRETLCVAQARISYSSLDLGRKAEHLRRLQKLIDEIDKHRPLGPDGKHGDLHTPTCGCFDERRIARLRMGDNSFGHDGQHFGVGTEECPKNMHHHHDQFCDYPSRGELTAAGIDPETFKVRNRA